MMTSCTLGMSTRLSSICVYSDDIVCAWPVTVGYNTAYFQILMGDLDLGSDGSVRGGCLCGPGWSRIWGFCL